MADGAATTRPSLSFPQMAYGTRQTPWDLRVLLHKGGASLERVDALDLIAKGHAGDVVNDRIGLVEKLHEILSAKMERGLSPHFMRSQLRAIWRFAAWADEVGEPFTLDSVADTFSAWTRALLHQCRVGKSLTEQSASNIARHTADLIARALNYPHARPGAALLRTTCLRPAARDKKRVLGAEADKQNLEQTFAFGHLLADICAGTDVSVLRGSLPVVIPLRDGRQFFIAGRVRDVNLNPDLLSKSKRSRAQNSRSPLPDNASLIDDARRSRPLNLRIEAELSIFTAQTGMNLAQAAKLRREEYRWQSDGEHMTVYRVFKGRRGGDAVFRCFRLYKAHLGRYLQWLDSAGFSETDDRLFPFVYGHSIPAEHTLPEFSATRVVCKTLGIKQFRPRHLRNTRVNWLLRRSNDADLTAEQSAHSKQTLLGVYARPHHQSAVAEIVRFHSTTDPTLVPPGPGLCASESGAPVSAPRLIADAPEADCVSPDGCLFCPFHRDVMNADYCWKLASHCKLKTLELTLYRPPKNAPQHPAALVIDRINAKLEAIAAGSEVRALWVRDARDAIRSGRFHTAWRDQIALFEAVL